MLECVQGLSIVQAASLSPRRPGFDLRPFCGIYGGQNGARTSRSPGTSTSFPYSSIQLYHLISPVARVAK